MDELIEALDEYIHLLGEELDVTAQIAVSRGWRSHRVEEGKELRERIKTLRAQYELSKLNNK